MGKHSLNIWNLVSLCFMRTIRRECNRHTFEDHLVKSINKPYESPTNEEKKIVCFKLKAYRVGGAKKYFH